MALPLYVWNPKIRIGYIRSLAQFRNAYYTSDQVIQIERMQQSGLAMNRFQAMVEIMAILNPDGLLKPNNPVYRRVREMASEKIQTLGPEAAVASVKKDRGHLLHQIKMYTTWHKITGCDYTDYI
jgi:hypothetical protein